MKTVGIQIKGDGIILVVLESDSSGNFNQTSESTKFGIDDHLKNSQVKQFRDQVYATLDSIKADKVGIIARNAKSKDPKRSPSPISFKLEGIFQLYKDIEVQMVWPVSISNYCKKTPTAIKPKYAYQEDAFHLAYYLLK